MSEKRSYDLKIDRAEKHLVDAETAIADYCARHPYAVRKRMEGQKQKVRWRLQFTEQPHDDIALMLADFLYNMRSGLDHLAAALVPAKKRRSVAYPIFWKGVWEPSIKGENQQRYKDRERWNSYTREMHPDAVALIKVNQPDDLGANESNGHPLAVLNRLRNADAHAKLPVVASLLREPTGSCRMTNGDLILFRNLDLDAMAGLEHDAEVFGLPDDAVDVKIQGSPLIVIEDSHFPDGGLWVEGFRDLILDGTRKLINALRPFDRLA